MECSNIEYMEAHTILAPSDVVTRWSAVIDCHSNLGPAPFWAREAGVLLLLHDLVACATVALSVPTRNVVESVAFPSW